MTFQGRCLRTKRKQVWFVKTASLYLCVKSLQRWIRRLQSEMLQTRLFECFRRFRHMDSTGGLFPWRKDHRQMGCILSWNDRLGVCWVLQIETKINSKEMALGAFCGWMLPRCSEGSTFYSRASSSNNVGANGFLLDCRQSAETATCCSKMLSKSFVYFYYLVLPGRSTAEAICDEPVRQCIRRWWDGKTERTRSNLQHW